MSKRKSSLILCLINVLLLCSCEESNLIYDFKNGDLLLNTVLSIKDEPLKNYSELEKYPLSNYITELPSFLDISSIIESKRDFVLYFTSKNCTHCLDTTLYLTPYIYNNQIQVYTLEYSKTNPEDYIFLANTYPNIFSSKLYFPNMYFISDGNLILKDEQSKYKNYKSLDNVFKSTLGQYNAYVFNKLESFINYKSDIPLYITNTYNKESTTDFIKDNFHNKLIKENIFNIFDTSLLNTKQNSTIFNILNIKVDLNSSFDYLIKIKNDEYSIESSSKNEILDYFKLYS